MSGRKVGTSSALDTALREPSVAALTLSSREVLIRPNGIEFPSAAPIAAWTEMTVDMEVPPRFERVSCNGVVVACRGSRNEGYQVSLLFTNLSRQSQERLNLIA